jgi:nucleotide-binding universal stress UspA family protein
MAWLPKNKVLVPVDFSEASLQAIETALQLVAKPSNLLVVHVLPEISAVEPGEIWRTIDESARIRHAATALRERLPESKYPGMQVDVLVGDPGAEVAQCAQRESVDLIVLPSHGRTGISRLLIGSVAERVVRLAHCPVLVLRS